MSVACVVLLGLVFSALVLRVLTVPGHFSVWAAGDAQMFAAGKHFAEEGFLAHKLLPLTNPGSPHGFIANNGPTGHYSHYPALHAVLNGAFIAAAHGLGIQNDVDIKGGLQIVYLLITAAGVGFAAAAVRRIYGAAIAAVFAGLVVLTPIVTGFGDSFCDQPLNLLLTGMFVFFASKAIDSDRRSIFDPRLALISFMMAQNTVELIPAFLAFYSLYGFIQSFPDPRRLAGHIASVILSVLLPIVASIAFHFYLSYLDFGSLEAFASHWHAIFNGRFATSGANWLIFLKSYLLNTNSYGPAAVLAVLIVIISVRLGMLLLKRGDQKPGLETRQLGFALAFATAMIAYPLVSPQQAFAMEAYTGYFFYVPTLLLGLLAMGGGLSQGRLSIPLRVFGALALAVFVFTAAAHGTRTLVSQLSVANNNDPFYGIFGHRQLRNLMKPEVNGAFKNLTAPQDLILLQVNVPVARSEVSSVWEFYLDRHALIYHDALDLQKICSVWQADQKGQPAESSAYRRPRLYQAPDLETTATANDVIKGLSEITCPAM